MIFDRDCNKFTFFFFNEGYAVEHNNINQVSEVTQNSTKFYLFNTYLLNIILCVKNNAINFVLKMSELFFKYLLVCGKDKQLQFGASILTLVSYYFQLIYFFPKAYWVGTVVTTRLYEAQTGKGTCFYVNNKMSEVRFDLGFKVCTFKFQICYTPKSPLKIRLPDKIQDIQLNLVLGK